MKGDHIAVMIVEDNAGDAYMVMELLQDMSPNLSVTILKDGKEAIDALTGKGPEVTDLIILDLNLPRVNGFEVLSFIKASPTLWSIPVVVITGSLRKEDEMRSRDLGAVDYHIKPGTAPEIERTRECLRGYLERAQNKGKRIGAGPISSAKRGQGAHHGESRQIPPPT